MNRHLFTVLLFALLVAGCASSLPYASDYPLTDEVFRSRDGVLAGKVPKGWFSSTDESVAPALLAWIVKEDFSATLALSAIALDAESDRQVGKDGLALLARISFALQRGISSTASMTAEPREFDLSGKKFCGYEITDGGTRKRIVVFGARGKYYECIAMSSHPGPGADEATRMFNAQQTLLASLSF